MPNRGCFNVSRDTQDPKDIHFKQLDLSEGEAIPDEQLHLRDEVDSVLTSLRILFDSDERKFEQYFVPLLSLAQLGLVGGSANPGLALRALATLKHDVLSREGGRIKNHYMKELGRTSLLLGLPAVLIGILVGLYAPSYIVLRSFLFLWAGCMAGVWLSFGARKIELKFEELSLLEKDRLNPPVRLVFAGLLAVVVGLLISTKAVVFELGGLSTEAFLSDVQAALVIGIFCGLSEQVLSTKVVQHASEFLGIR